MHCTAYKAFRTPSVSHGFFFLESFRSERDADVCCRSTREATSHRISRYNCERTIYRTRVVNEITDAFVTRYIVGIVLMLYYSRAHVRAQDPIPRLCPSVLCPYLYLTPLLVPPSRNVFDVPRNLFVYPSTFRWV